MTTPAFSVSPPAAEAGVSAHRRFTLGTLNIDGATIFTEQQLSRHFESYLATEVDGTDLAKIAAAITAQYHHAGYLLSYATVPTQNVEAGMVRLLVVEGRISNVIVQGAGPAKASIEALATPLMRPQPLRAGELERTIGLIRDFPGFKVTDVALVRSEITGNYTLKIAMAPMSVHGFVYFDNRGTDSVARSRFYTSLSLSSLALPGDELRIDLFGMPGRHSHYLYGQGLVALPLGRQGLRLSLIASRGDQYLQAAEHFSGQSDNAAVQLSYPIRRSRSLTLLAKLSMIDWRVTGTRWGQRQLRDRLRVGRFDLAFNNEGPTHFEGDVSLSEGIGFAGMTRAGDPFSSRPGASGEFTKVAGIFQISHPLRERLTLRAIAMGQYSDRPLLSAEEFSLGGTRIGRAFAFNSLTVDRGAGAGLELGYHLGKVQKNGSGVEIFGFVDGGFGSSGNASTPSNRSSSLASAGSGARFSLAAANVSVEGAIPLASPHHDSARLFVSVFRNF